jgi:hypothetical protein
MARPLAVVMAGLRPGHPRLYTDSKDVDARHKGGNDEKYSVIPGRREALNPE